MEHLSLVMRKLASWRRVLCASPTWRGRDEEQVKVRSRVQSSSGEALRQLALHGHGVVLMPQWSVAADIAAGRLAALMDDYDTTPTNAPFQHNVFAVYQRARHQSPKLKAFLQILVAAMAEAGGPLA